MVEDHTWCGCIDYKRCTWYVGNQGILQMVWESWVTTRAILFLVLGGNGMNLLGTYSSVWKWSLVTGLDITSIEGVSLVLATKRRDIVVLTFLLFACKSLSQYLGAWNLAARMITKISLSQLEWNFFQKNETSKLAFQIFRRKIGELFESSENLQMKATLDEIKKWSLHTGVFNYCWIGKCLVSHQFSGD